MKRIFAWTLALLLLAGCTAHSAVADAPKDAAGPVSAADTAAEADTADAAAEPVTLKLAGIDITGEPIDAMVKAFNQAQDAIVIELTDYGTEFGPEEKERAASLLTTEILAGSRPDLVYFPDLQFWGTSTINLLSPLPFIGQGLLLDLDPYVAQDPDLHPEDILIWDALHQYGGLYLVSDLFSVQTVVCAPSFYADHAGWTIAEYLELEAALPDGCRMFDAMHPAYFLLGIGSRYMQKALDLEQAACDFDNAEFIALLDSATKVREYTPVWDGGVCNQMMKGTLIGCYTDVRAPWSVAFDRTEAGRTEPMAYIGWPTPDGSGGSDIHLLGSLGVMADTAHKDACWQFVKYMIMNPGYIYDKKLEVRNQGFPLYIPAMPENPETLTDPDHLFEPLQSDADAFLALVSQCTTMNFYDDAIMDIILEEAQELLAGNVTAAETAKNIQDRASLYMLEQYG